MSALGLASAASRIGDKLIDIIGTIENIINYNIVKARKTLLKIAIQFILFAVSLVFLLSGVVLFFSRFFPMDLVLVLGGALILYAALLFNVIK
jgi:hypothetical protein